MIIFQILMIVYLLIYCHELCHYLCFICQGISIRKFYVIPFEINILHNSIKIKLKIEKKYLGIVIPKTSTIYKVDIGELRSKYLKAIIGSVYMHTILSVLGGILYMYINSENLLIFVCANLFMLLQGFCETNSAYGDIVAFEKIKGNYIEFLRYLLFVFINNEEVPNENMKFIKSELEIMFKHEKKNERKLLIQNCMSIIDEKLKNNSE